MANWCVNWVTVIGEEANVSSLMDEVNALSVKANVKDRGVRPSEIGDLQYMFFININVDDSFSFESKWTPSNDSLQLLAKKYRVTLENSYYDPGTMLYGKWTSDGETEDDVRLTDEEWGLVVPGDEDGSFYIYKGQEYEVQEDALEEILISKIKKLNGIID